MENEYENLKKLIDKLLSYDNEKIVMDASIKIGEIINDFIKDKNNIEAAFIICEIISLVSVSLVCAMVKKGEYSAKKELLQRIYKQSELLLGHTRWISSARDG
jgi:hypothetical protein